MKFAVIGGDMRQARLAELLRSDGHDTSVFALDKIRLSEGVVQEGTARYAVEGADCVVLPLPLQSREGMLSSPLSEGLHTVHEIVTALSPGQLVLLGRADDASRALFRSEGLSFTDYFEREELAVANAVAAAEGAVGLIMQETAITIWRARVLVLGFGRIGKLLSHRLRGLGADVTATARTPEALAWIRAYGYEALETSCLDGRLGDFDVIVNTIPARIMTAERLSEVGADCLCLDLASKPGGLDFTAASKLGVRAMWALSLPGEVAPTTSGVIIRDTIYNILREKGLMI
ncbi:MAG: dipicolinate synthase subunit DpsA [Oscillospiraceae bacterium]|jgi:dipicolinate synthase subunit A|nr:dipicolinate synthase subunit DpsA [Oscillospiraceae bacterium]